MRFSYSWLSELSGYKGSASHLAELLSLQAFETEILRTEGFAKIVVTKVLKVQKHPNADRLRIIELTDGKHKYSPVVCGAWNFDAGAIVPLALPGAVIPHDQHDPEEKPFTLGKATIRGVESQGMICSAKELGLGSDGGGILLLDSSYKLGEEFRPHMETKDIVFDISVPANRPDLLSHRGVAREISVLTNSKPKFPSKKVDFKKFTAKVLKVRVSEKKLCPMYSAMRFSGVVVAKSPDFIQKRLLACGLRPINNIVDITNYVMLELGQPLHAFDVSRVSGGINVRKAYLNETLKTLDGTERKLSPDMLVIADAQKAIAVAGVIGGENSAVNARTSEIILEAASFNPVSVRRTARQLGIRTDASARFEKSLPPAFVDAAMEYASELLQKYAQAKPLEYAVDQNILPKPLVIQFNPEDVNKLLGLNLNASRQKSILSKYGFGVKVGKTFLVTVPSWRPDVGIWQDLAEDIGRFVGLNNIEGSVAKIVPSSHMTDPVVNVREQVIDLLVGMGFNEVYTYSFVSAEILTKHNLDAGKAVEIANPLSADQQYMRMSLGMNYEKMLEHNSNFYPSGNYFEIGNVYWKTSGKIVEKTKLFMMSSSKQKGTEQKLLGAWNELMQRLGIDSSVSQNSETEGEIELDGVRAGSVRASEDAEIKWTALEVDFDAIVQNVKPKQYIPIIRFPSKELDVALMVKEEISWQKIKSEIQFQKAPLLQKIELLEVYRGKNLSPGKKSVTFRLTYQSDSKTLTDEEVEKIHKQILEIVRNKTGAQIRD